MKKRTNFECATVKHPQSNGMLEQGSLKSNQKMLSGEYRRQSHKYLPIAVLNDNTAYHSTFGCEPTRIFHGRFPYKVLDHKLANNPLESFAPTTDFDEPVQKSTKLMHDETKKILMQSDIKYKDHYD